MDLVVVGIAIIIAGFAVVLFAMALSASSSRGGDEGARVKGGGVIMVGPIPIVFGSDARWASVAMVLAIILVVVALLSGALVGR